eukprot:gb/GECG01010891.1/.p1 GENE.gb/GECG01010891.1/~~gb/GECG01010891.1/.p1  ORF type:complete len:415 (+),score=64.42 gb/GECG01010891.1/:1-1245(+)
MTSFTWENVSSDESVIEELSMLEAIYPEYLSVDEKHQTVCVTLSPQIGDEGLAMVRASLLLIFHEGYPHDSPPAIRLINGRGLSDSTLHELEHHLRKSAESFSGANCVFQLVEEARDRITETNEAGAECEICFGKVDQNVENAKKLEKYTGEVGFVTPCLHVFHQRCFSRWMWQYDQRINQSSERQSEVHAAQSRITAARNSVQQFQETIEHLSQQISNDTERIHSLEGQYREIGEQIKGSQKHSSKKKGSTEVSAEELSKQQRELRIEIDSVNNKLRTNNEKVKNTQSKLQDARQKLKNIEDHEAGRLQSRSKDTPCPCCREIVPISVIGEATCPPNMSNFYDACEHKFGNEWSDEGDSSDSQELKTVETPKWDIPKDISDYISKVKANCESVFQRQKENGGLIESIDQEIDH